MLCGGMTTIDVGLDRVSAEPAIEAAAVHREPRGSRLLLAAHHVAGVGLTWSSGHGSQNLDGGAASALATLSSVAGVLVVAAVWWWHARGPVSDDALVRACAAAVLAFVALGKVLPGVTGALRRLEFGAGYGIHQHEFLRWKLPFAERREMGVECMDIVLKAWTEETVTYDEIGRAHV